ncbi:MAG: repeat protein, partial [Verrucomicrobia bacterium]|nr:repeat protein [Verrucomicrobiota bacterium]
MQLTKHWAASLDDYVIDLGWSPDGALLAAASASGPIALFAASDGAKRHELHGHDGGTNCITWNAPTTVPMLASGGQDGAVKFWDATAGQHVATASLGTAWVEHLAWRGALLFGAAGKNLTALRADGSVAHAFKPAPKTISALAWQPSGGCVAVSYFGGVCLWDADDFVVQK